MCVEFRCVSICCSLWCSVGLIRCVSSGFSLFCDSFSMVIGMCFNLLFVFC